MATVRVEAWNVLIATFVFTVGVASAGHAQADHEARGFVDRIASSIFTAAWPTATYEETSIRSISPVTGGYNVSVRFAGQSMWGGPLRLDMILMLRGGRLYDLRVTNHNAVLAEPFSTAKAVGAFVASVAESYVEDAARQRAAAPPPRASYSLQIANDCHLPISVWLRYQLPSGEWVTNGQWDLAGLTATSLRVGSGEETTPLRIRSRVVYSYAVPVMTDTGLSWSGEREVPYGNSVLSMRTDTLRDDGTGGLTLARHCSNIRRLGVRGEDAGSYEYGGKVYTRGARFTDVEAGYLGERMGLQPGDVAYNVNNQWVDDWETFVRYIVRSTGEPLTVHLIRAGRNLRFESPAEAGR